MMILSCQHRGAAHVDAVPAHADTVPSHADTVPSHADTVPSHADTVPSHADTVPSHVDAIPSHADTNSHASTARSYAGTDSLPVGVSSTRVDESTLVDSSTRVDESTLVGTRWLVIAPHPDDESLMAGGVLFRAQQAGAEAAVVVVTNGDLDCLNDGVRRQGEAVAALSILGIPEDRAYFLGYPDGGLALLGRTPLPPRARILDHACVSGNTTYGARGFGRRDYHSARFGSPVLYTRDNAESDLAMLLDQLRPTDVVVSHPDDTHPDHVATYSLFRSALDRIIDVLPEAPRVHRAIVHNGDCWPTGNAAKEPCPPGQVAPEQPTPPLTGRLSGYLARERLMLPARWQLTDSKTNPKARAIAAHSSQTRNSSASYLFSFVRSDEVFFPEWLGKVGGHWRRIPQPMGGQTQQPIGAQQTQNPMCEQRQSQTLGEMRQRDEAVGELRPRLIALGSRHHPAALVQAQVGSLAVPLAISMRLLRPSSVDGQSVARLELLGDDSGAYALTIDAERSMATLSRTFAHRSEMLHEWPLPHDVWQGDAAESITIAIERYPEDGSSAELTLYCRDDIVGAVTDVQPRLQGERVTLSNAVTVDGNLTVWARSQLGAAVAVH